MKTVQQGFTLIELMTVKAKVQTGPSLASPSLTALGVACSEGTLGTAGNNTAASNGTLGLSQDTSINSGTINNYVTKVTTSGTGNTTGTVVITYGTGITAVSGGTVTYNGTCSSASGMTWQVVGGGAFAGTGAKYLPKT
jgi:type IV pilus assembly protein PilA